MSLSDKAKKAVGAASAVAVLVNISRSDKHQEVESVTFAGIPLFKRDERGNPRVFGIPFRRRKAPRAE